MQRILILFSLLSSLTPAFTQGPVYLPLGDSYTICEGLKEEERWPNLLAGQLEKNGSPVQLAYNPSRTGYTTQDLIKHELPYLKTTKPAIVTLLIGVNDYVQGYDTSHFHQNLHYILDEIQRSVKTKTHIILITIPDYSVTPAGAYYTNGRNVTADLKIWNHIIQQEATNRQLPCIDIFPLTLKMKDSPDLVGADGLHPSAQEVALWAELIYPEMLRLVKKSD